MSIFIVYLTCIFSLVMNYIHLKLFSFSNRIFLWWPRIEPEPCIWRGLFQIRLTIVIYYYQGSTFLEKEKSLVPTLNLYLQWLQEILFYLIIFTISFIITYFSNLEVSISIGINHGWDSPFSLNLKVLNIFLKSLVYFSN